MIIRSENDRNKVFCICTVHHLETIQLNTIFYYDDQKSDLSFKLREHTKAPGAFLPNSSRPLESSGHYLHREDGPALIHGNGVSKYFINNMLHRVSGPAIIHRHNSIIIHSEWFYFNKKFTNKEDWFAALSSEDKYKYLWNMDELDV